MTQINRRKFVQSLTALVSLPTGLGSAIRPAAALVSAPAGAAVSVAAVPKNVQFWAIYMSGLHGECSPATLHQMLQIPEVDAKRYLSNMIADGLIKPNPLLRKTVSTLVQSKEKKLTDRLKSRLDKKERLQSGSKISDVAEAEGAEQPVQETATTIEPTSDAALETEIEVSTESECIERGLQAAAPQKEDVGEELKPQG